MHEKKRGVGDGAEGFQRFDEVMRCFEPMGIENTIVGFKAFPSGKANAHVFLHTGFAQDAGEVAVLVAGLAHEAQGLPQHALKTAVGDFGIGKAFVAGEKGWGAARHDDADGFLKARIMARGPGDIRHMLAVAIDHQRIKAMGGHPREQLLEARRIDVAAQFRFSGGAAEIRQVEGCQLGMAHGELRLESGA